MSVNYWRREGRVKLYDYTRAPNPRRVRIFLAEKGMTVPMVQLDLFQGAHMLVMSRIRHAAVVP